MPSQLGLEIPKFEINELRHPNGLFRFENLDSTVPDHVKVIIADIILNWAEVETRLRWLSFKLFYAEAGIGAEKIAFYDRYRILKDLVREEKKFSKDIPNFWKLLAADKPIVYRVRNLLSHGHTVGVWTDPPNFLFIANLEKGGRIEYYSLPFDLLEKARDLIKISAEAIDNYTAAMREFELANVSGGSDPR